MFRQKLGYFEAHLAQDGQPHRDKGRVLVTPQDGSWPDNLLLCLSTRPWLHSAPVGTLGLCERVLCVNASTRPAL